MAESGELRAYPQRLCHAVPDWVGAGSYFHIRLRTARENRTLLTQPEIALKLLESVRHYHDRGRWHSLVFLLMPDHAHALIAFPLESRMSRVVGEWKHYTSRAAGIKWQTNFFDHRIRNRFGLAEKYAYILRNPLVKGLCATESDWRWVWMPLAGE
jgi:putative transposase